MFEIRTYLRELHAHVVSLLPDLQGEYRLQRLLDGIEAHRGRGR